jgi:hypothetical protein
LRLKQKTAVYLIGLLSMWLVLPVAHSASSSANYSITRTVISSAGNTSSSLSYAVQSVIGQTAATTSTSTNHILRAGFLSTSDTDGDGVFDNVDNCINDFNTTQLDTDSDGSGDACDIDDDGDGLTDVLEATLGTNPLLIDTDNDGLSDFVEVNFDGNPNNYQVGVDTDPNDSDTDGDALLDGSDPSPLISEPYGDIAPLGAPDGIINAADVLITRRIVLGELIASPQELARGDTYPPGSPDGVINLQDLILIQGLVLP